MRAVEQCATGVLLHVEARADVGGGGVPRRTGEEQATAVDQTEGRMPGAAGGDRAVGVADSGRVQRMAPRRARLCPLCFSEVEDAEHTLLRCSA